MKRKLILPAFLILFSLTIKAQEIKSEAIISKYSTALGYNKLQKAKTITMTGSIIRQDVMPLKIIKMRPDKYRMEFEVQDVPALQVYNGQKAWWTTPWTGNATSQPMPEDRLNDIIGKADFEGAVFNWKEKGSLLEFVAKEKLDSLQAYKLKLTKKNGSIEYYFFDAKTFLIAKQITFRQIKGTDVEVENYYYDYRTVEGIKFPFKTESKMGGQPYSQIEYDTIEIDKPIDLKIFEMPEK